MNGGSYSKFNGGDKQNSVNQRTIFLPLMLCSRSAIKDVKLSHRSASSHSDDPLSPRVGCAGQIIRRNNKVIGFPAPHKLIFTNAVDNSNNHTTSSGGGGGGGVRRAHHKLRTFFSSKSLGSRADRYSNVNTCRGGGREVRQSDVMRGAITNRSKSDCCNRCPPESVNVADLDPPLPVIRKVRKIENGVGEGKDNLWKRRSGGVALESLQVKPIQIQSCRQLTLQANSV